MAKKSSKPGPSDVPPPEPDDLSSADLFDFDAGSDTDVDPPLQVNISDAEVIDSADLYDLSETVTEPTQAAHDPGRDSGRPLPASPTPADDEDIFAWGVLEEGSMVGKRAGDSAAGSSILDLRDEPAAPRSGWLESEAGLETAADDGGRVPGPLQSTSGVDLHDPDATPRGDSDSASSIFGRKAADQSSRVALDLPSGTDDGTEAIPIDVASIWDESDSADAARMMALRDDDAAGTLGWELPEGDDERQQTMRAPRPNMDEDDELASWLDQEVRESAKPATTPIPKPIPDTTAVGMPVAPQSAPKRAAPAAVHVPDLDDDDDGDYMVPVKAEPKRSEPKRSEPKPAGAKKGAAGWIGGGLAGLLIGGGGVFGLSQMGILPGGETKPAARQPAAGVPNPGAINPGPNVPAVLAPEQALAALDRGDAAAAKSALDGLTGDQLTAAMQATRGHARLLARVQELADSGAAVKADDKDLADAGSDLKAVFDKAGELKTADEQAAAVRAALNLGLLKELAGDTSGAAKVYTDAAAAVPAGKREFETALKRLKLTAPVGNRGGDSGKTSRLTPRQGQALLLAVAVLLQGEPVPTPGPAKVDNEPGHLFWDAANAAASNDFAAAADLIGKAKAAHEARRLKLIGRGTNPKSDPAEQIFLSTCDQLKELYTLKATLYGHPVAGPLAKSDGAAKALDKLADAQKVAEKADDARLKAIQEALKAEMQRKAVADELDVATKALTAKTNDLTKAMADLAAAEKVKSAREDALAGMVKEFKAAKLLPEDADLTAALAKLPDIAKQAGATALSGDAKKAAEALLAAKKELETSQAELKTATADLAKAMKLADDRTKELTDVQAGAKASDAALAGVVKEFKAAKLIPEDDDAATALAKLPAAAKKAASAAVSGDAEKAAEALLAAKKELETAQMSLKKAETDLTAAKKAEADATALARKEADDKAAALKMIDTVKADAAKALKAAQDDADKAAKMAQDADKAAKAALDAEKVAKTALDDAMKALTVAKKEADDKLKLAVDKAVADADTKLKAAEATATTAADAAAKALADRKAAEDKLAAAKVQFDRELAAAKVTGLPVLPAEAVAQDKAEAAYTAGLRLYFAGDYANAEGQLRVAASVNDARHHYFLGLALLAQGKADAATSFRAGYELERRNMPNARDIGEALERVQGPARAELAKYRR